MMKLRDVLIARGLNQKSVVWKHLTIIPPNVITSVTIPDGVTEVDKLGFSACSTLTKVTAPESLKKIGDTAFADSPLVEVSFPGVEFIGDNAFAGKAALTSTKGCFPKVKIIGNTAFRPCATLVDFDFPELKELGNSATQACPAITEINIPKCKYIGYSNFGSLTLSASLELPECRKIDMGCFSYLNCSRVVLPKIEKICQHSFLSCTFEALILSNPAKVCELETDCLNNMTQDDTHGWIYVPSALVESYKTAENWSAYADQIRAIEDYPEITGG